MHSFLGPVLLLQVELFLWPQVQGPALLGACPHKAENEACAAAQIIFHVTIQNKSLEFPSSVPESLRSIGTQCMEKESSQRPTMTEVVERLEAIKLGA